MEVSSEIEKHVESHDLSETRLITCYCKPKKCATVEFPRKCTVQEN